MILPAKYLGRVKEKDNLTESVTRLVIECIEPKEFNFIAGQFINLEVAPATYRAYSVTSGIGSSNTIELAIITGRPGKGANYVKSLKVGDDVNFIGPSGRNFFTKPARENILFAATGTGLAPFLPMIEDAIASDEVKRIQLFFGVSTQEDIFYEDRLKQFENSPKFSYKIYLSREETNIPPYISGRVTQGLLDYCVESTDFYLCGNPNMIKDSIGVIGSCNLTDHSVHVEAFN